MKKVLSILLAILLSFNSLSTVCAEGNPGVTSPIKLDVVAPQTVTIGEGYSTQIPVEVKNFSPEYVSKVSAQAYIDNPDKAYIQDNGYIFQNTELNSEKSGYGSFYIRTDADFTTKTVPIQIKLRYYDEANGLHEQTETIYVRVEAPEKPAKPVNPALEITQEARMWQGEVEAGKAFTAAFNVKNTGDAVAKNIKLSVEGLENGKVTVAKGLSTADITSLAPGEDKPVFFDLKTFPTTPAGSYMLTLKYSFVGEGEETKAPKEGSYGFSIDIKKTATEKALLEFANISFPTGTISRNQSASISFDVVNKSKKNIKNVTVTAMSQNAANLASKSVSTVKTDLMEAGKSYHYKFDFIASVAAETGNYPVDLKVSYIDENGETPVEITQIVGVFVKAPKPADPNAKDQSPIPKLIIEEYSFAPEIIEAGEPFNMHLTLYNTNATKSVRNIKIFLTSDIKESVSNSGDNSSSSTQSSGGGSTASVFTPVGSSNTFYVNEIKPGQRVEKEITLTTVPDTAAKTYTVVANFEYEDAKANKYEATEQIGVPIIQKAKLEVGDIIPQGEFFVGQENPVTVDYFNTGKAVLYNVMVKISGDGMKFDTPTMYKGNFSPGSSEQFSVSVTPEKEGKNKFSITFSYEDSTGQKASEVREYEFETTEIMMDMPMEEMPPEKSGFNPLLLIVPALGVLIAATVIIYRKRKKKSDEEDLNL